MEDVVVKLGDFGLSTFVEDERAPSTYAGTKEYMAPVNSLYFQISIVVADTSIG